jgi:prevent-host-death family protein
MVETPSELTPIDIRHVPELARLLEEVERTGQPRRITRGGRDVAVIIPAALMPPRRQSRPVRRPADAGTDPILAELERRRRLGLNVADMTAGILKPYVTRSAATMQEAIRAEKDAFEQAVADEAVE